VTLDQTARVLLEDFAAQVVPHIPHHIVWEVEIVPSEVYVFVAYLVFASQADPSEELVVASILVSRSPEPEAVFDVTIPSSRFLGETRTRLPTEFDRSVASDAVAGSAEFFQSLVPQVVEELSSHHR
jgi:hypothetical protein